MTTPLVLQDLLVEDIKELLQEFSYKTPGGERVPMNVYAQGLPVNASDDDADPVPYIIVRLNSGEDAGSRDSNNVVRLVIIIGVWDDDLNNQGHRDVMNIIQKIYHRFHVNPCLKEKAVYGGEFSWAMQEDTYYPYSFGACSLSFNIAAIRREDEFA